MEDTHTPETQDPGTQNPDPRTINPGTPRPPRRQAVKWNYKRIVAAIIAVAVISTVAIYSGFTLAHKISGRSAEKGKVAVEAKKVTPAVKQPSATKEVKETKKPGYIEHTVKSGDTLYTIALKYHTTIDKIRELNGIDKDENRLDVGTTLKIPTKDSAQSEDNNTGGAQNQNAKDTQDTRTGDTPSTSTIKPSAKEIVRGPTSAMKVALTFDAGSGSEVTPQIIKALEEANVKATFFLTGKWVDENPQLAKKIAEDGNLIGNHTDTHPDLTKLTDDEIVQELKSADQKIQAKAGMSSKPLFRTPYGARDPRVLKVAANAGYRSVYWTVDSLDWKPSMTPDQVKNRILAGLSNGAIILEHCGSQQTAKILPELIKDIKSRGYEIVTVPELFE